MPEVIYEDNHLLILNKPAGTLIQADNTQDKSLFEEAKEYIKTKYNKPGAVYLGLIHRLDRPVSGTICFARTSKAASRLSDQFRKRLTHKIYTAVIEGKPKLKNGTLSNWFEVNKGKKSRNSTISSHKNSHSKKAELRYKVLAENDKRSLLEIELLTGYKHQIRAQLAHCGHPVVGDFRYSLKKYPVEKILNGRAIMLHASSLTIIHPTQKKEIMFTANLPEYFTTFKN